MINMELRLAIYKSNVYQYEIAKRLGITDYKLCRLLRTEITKRQAKLILDTLKELEKEKEQEEVKL